MAPCCRRYRPGRLQALQDDPELLVIRPASTPSSLNKLQPFNLSTVLMAVHKHCYTSLKPTKQGGPRRRKTSLPCFSSMVLMRGRQVAHRAWSHAAPLGSVCPLHRRSGRICTDNAAERALRGFSPAPKWGADRAAVMATLIMTAKLNDLDP